MIHYPLPLQLYKLGNIGKQKIVSYSRRKESYDIYGVDCRSVNACIYFSGQMYFLVIYFLFKNVGGGAVVDCDTALQTVRPFYGPGMGSIRVSKRKREPGISPRAKDDRCVGLTTLSSSYADFF